MGAAGSSHRRLRQGYRSARTAVSTALHHCLLTRKRSQAPAGRYVERVQTVAERGVGLGVQVAVTVQGEAHRGMPDPGRTRSTNQPGTRAEPARQPDPDSAGFVGSVACPWWPLGMPRHPPSPGSKGQGSPPGQTSPGGQDHGRGQRQLRRQPRRPTPPRPRPTPTLITLGFSLG